jgi:Flp pilus assembly protein TadG
VAIIGAGGIAFDYARLAGMDTELQQAADQAALAAATQLDGEPDAILRAEAAGRSLIANKTIFANDGLGTGVGNLTFTFYTSYNQDSDNPGPTTTSGLTAKVVMVNVGGRTAKYALTPIVGALSSGLITAQAVAALGTAVCKAPPLMICNPNDAADPNFTQDYAGRGFLLVARQNSTAAYGPGNFGFLATGYDATRLDDPTSNGAKNLRRALGQLGFSADCFAGDSVTTEPGSPVPALAALNTRFDIYDSTSQVGDVCGNGQCPPASNVRKDIMRDAPAGSPGTGAISRFCKPASDPDPDTDKGLLKGWALLPDASKRYLPSANAPLTTGQRSSLYPMGLPRDICHAWNPSSGCSGGRLGTGAWDRDAYFHSNYGAGFDWRATSGLGPTVTRYGTYLWEIANKNRNPGGISRSYNVPSSGTLHSAPICQTSGVSDPVGDLDRRKLTVAVADCSGNKINGKVEFRPLKWIDIFLVEPSWDRSAPSGVSPRTTKSDLYIEVIGQSKITGAGGQTYQVERSVPFLVK